MDRLDYKPSYLIIVNMAKTKMTIEDLAVMVKKGFDQTVTKEEFRKELGITKEEFRKELGLTREEFRREMKGVRGEIKELKEQIVHLAADVAQLKEEINRDDPFVEDLLRRMRVVEKRVGIVK